MQLNIFYAMPELCICKKILVKFTSIFLQLTFKLLTVFYYTSTSNLFSLT